MLLVLAVPVIASLFNTFSQADYGRCMVWDSAHYAVSGKLLLDWLKQLAAGHYQNPHDMDLS